MSISNNLTALHVIRLSKHFTSYMNILYTKGMPYFTSVMDPGIMTESLGDAK